VRRLAGAALAVGLAAGCREPDGVAAARQARWTLSALGVSSDGASCGLLDGGVARCEVWIVGHPSVPLDCSALACRVPEGVELPRAFGDRPASSGTR
jgi:hypothetical protein